MNIRPLESLTKEELIELIKHEREHIADAGKMAEYEIWGNFPGYLIDHCEGEVITEEFLQNALSKMLEDPKYLEANEILKQDIAICEECGGGIVSHNPGICGTCYATNMPHPGHIPDDGKMGAPTDTEMLNWLIEKEALICHSVTANLYEIWFDIDNVETGKTAREAITKAMRGEE